MKKRVRTEITKYTSTEKPVFNQNKYTIEDYFKNQIYYKRIKG